MFPQAGGQYVYLKEAYSKLVAFLYGWSFFAVIQTGTIAAVGVAFAKFTAYLFPSFSDENVLYEIGIFKLNAAQLISIATIILVTFIERKRVRNAKYLQTFFTYRKIAYRLDVDVLGSSVAFDIDVWNAN